MEDEKHDLIKAILLWTGQDYDYLHEATGLFEADIARGQRRLASLFSREHAELQTTALGLKKPYSQTIGAIGESERKFEPDVIEEIRNYYAWLQGLSLEELEAERENKRQQSLDYRDQQRPYNRPENQLDDYGFWVRRSLWSRWEAILLLGGREPKPDVVEYLDTMGETELLESHFACGAIQVMDLMNTAVQAGEISSPGRPLEYLSWFDKMKWNVPEKLRQGILEIHAPNSPQERALSLLDTEKQSLLKLVAGMAIGGYRFDPSAKRNQATADIQSDLERLGVELDSKTILKWLREACAVLPEEAD